MPLVFIDANIYLDPYRRKMDKYRHLLGSLGAIKDLILITKTVCDEVERNRVSAYRTNNSADHLKFSFKFTELRPHHSDDTTDVDKLNKEARQLENDIARKSKDLKERAEEFDAKNLISIINGEDDVTKSLESIFSSCSVETPEQLQRARDRKERGYPPGKKGDPLGDQISWEQLLDASEGKGTIWIVTRDGDYTESAANNLYLNPFLHREIMGINGVSGVKCFSDLAKFFESFRSEGGVREDLLPSREVVEAAKEEINEAITSSLEGSYARGGIGNVDDKVEYEVLWPCWPPSCAGSSTRKHEFNFLVPRPSGRFGGWTYQGQCKNCGVWVDAGEPYDD